MPDTNLSAEALGNPLSEAQSHHGEHPRSERLGEPTRHDQTPAILAYLITAGFFALLASLIFVRPPDSNLAMLNIVLGSLGTAWLGSIAYFFGGTAGRMKSKTVGSGTNPNR